LLRVLEVEVDEGRPVGVEGAAVEVGPTAERGAGEDEADGRPMATTRGWTSGAGVACAARAEAVGGGSRGGGAGVSASAVVGSAASAGVDGSASCRAGCDVGLGVRDVLVEVERVESFG